MTEKEVRESVSGAAPFIEWFGRWPQFHDSEIIRCDLQRADTSQIVVHTFEMTDVVNGRGYFETEKHALVTFSFSGIEQLELSDFNNQNVLFGLELNYADNLFTISLNPAYGLGGFVVCKELSLEWIPGKPREGVYVR